MCVCLFVSVCWRTPPGEIIRYRHMIYGSKQNLSGKVVNYISSQTDQRFKSYEPKRRADWRKNDEKTSYFQILFDVANRYINDTLTLTSNKKI